MEFEMNNPIPKDVTSLEDVHKVNNKKENKKGGKNFRNVWKKVSYNLDTSFILSHISIILKLEFCPIKIYFTS